MAYRKYWVLIASVSAAALMLATQETFARSGVAAGGFSAARPIPNASVVPWLRHRARHGFGGYWTGGYYYGGASDDRSPDILPDVTPMSREIRYTYTCLLYTSDAADE